MYALTGANGNLGRLVIKQLLGQLPANQIIATTRDPQQLADIAALGVSVRRADFSEPATLAAAYAGATSLLIISTYVAGKSVELHKAAIAGAVEAGVKHLVYTSIPHADPESANPLLADHGQTELALAASGLPWIALRNSIYTEFLKNFVDFLLVKRQFLIPQNSNQHSWIFREDCARTAVGALIGKLTSSGPLDVTGPEALNFDQLGARLAALSNGQITPQPLSDHEIIAQVTAEGVPAEAAQSTMRFIHLVAQAAPDQPTATVDEASGIKPTSVDTIFRAMITA